MAIVPTVRCRNMKASVDFYTTILDFERFEVDDDLSDPSFSVLKRDGDPLILSSFPGDGVFGHPVAVYVDDVSALFRKYLERGLKTPGNPDSPVHEGPIDQSWGTREFYVDDPDGNTLRFLQQLRG